jgi:hypothetical protein
MSKEMEVTAPALKTMQVWLAARYNRTQNAVAGQGQFAVCIPTSSRHKRMHT